MIDSSKLRELASRYLTAYADKDLDDIAEMLTGNVTLQDWNVSGQGSDFFLNETQKNFDNAEQIEIEVLQLLTTDDSVAAVLAITVDGSIKLDVVDVMTFDSNGKMTALRAYKG